MGLFGTDGIRALIDDEIFSPKLLKKLGYAITRTQPNIKKVIIGGDTRQSRETITTHLSQGLCQNGCQVIDVGVIPTPGIAFLVIQEKADLGMMISASHNLHPYNGIKIFDKNGLKISATQENAIEQTMSSPEEIFLSTSNNYSVNHMLVQKYTDYIVNNFSTLKLSGYKIVLDCGNGAFSDIAEYVLQTLGANVISCGSTPDGININHNVGSTFPKNIIKNTLDHKADLGIAFDGDGDRIIIVTKSGKVLDGEQMIAFIIKGWLHLKEDLQSSNVISTVMSNVGFQKFLSSHGLTLHQTNVGDRHIVKKLLDCNAIIGGEPSGHIIIPKYSTAVDAMFVALEVLRISHQGDLAIDEVFTPYPYLLENIPITFSGQKTLCQETMQQIKTHYPHCYILIRPSGTEPIIRVYIQGNNAKELVEIMEKIKENIIKKKA